MHNRFVQIRDRHLGDEWKNWEGELDPCVQNAETGKRIFLNLLLLAILFVCFIGIGVWYLISPRLNELVPFLSKAFLWSWLAFCAFFFVWFLLITLSIFFKKDLLLRLGKREFSVAFILPLILRLGKKLGIPNDRLAHSFVQVSNALIGIRPRKIKPKSLLILLPRCLEKSLQNQIVSLAKLKNIPIYIVPGGELARRLVKEKQPRAIIGVACERDLLSGIKDLTADIPVIGIPNIRPEGPCKNTRIDLRELEKALDLFLGDTPRPVLPPHP
jgi:hypothetical protein